MEIKEDAFESAKSRRYAGKEEDLEDADGAYRFELPGSVERALQVPPRVRLPARVIARRSGLLILPHRRFPPPARMGVVAVKEMLNK